MSIETLEIHPVFSTPLWSAQANLDNNTLVNWCYEQKVLDPVGTEKSNMGGWQSQLLDLSDEFALSFATSLFPYIDGAAEDITGVSAEVLDVNISGAWININHPGCYNQVHSHSGAHLSGVYYAKVPENSGNLIMRRGNDSFNLAGIARGVNNFNHTECTVTPLPGLLVLFPAWSDHLIQINRSEEDRISIAFNISIADK
jgi:uncharacterized protein (TIGR02466 family)